MLGSIRQRFPGLDVPKRQQTFTKITAESSWGRATLGIWVPMGARGVQEAEVEMSFKSLSVKLYLGVVVLAGVLWLAGVSGQTIVSLALVGLMLAMHAGGHGGHGGHGSRDARSAETGHAGHGTRAGSAEALDRNPAGDKAQPPTRSGCH